jgi:hypothetical protein
MRPRRLYIDDKNKPYYLINKKKVYIKVPKNISMKQLQKVNIKNIIQLPQIKRVKKRKGKKTKGVFDKKITTAMIKGDEIGGLPSYLFQEKKDVPELALAGRKKSQDLIFVPSKVNVPLQMALPIEAKTPIMPPPPPITPRSLKKKIEERFFSDKTPNKDLLDKLKSKTNPTKEEKVAIKALERNLEYSYENPPVQPLFKEGEFASAFLKSYTGKGNGDDGLYNDEIEMIAKKRVKHFVPCIPADKTEELLKYVARGDKDFAFVINTNPSDSNGTGEDGYRPGHWTCCYIDNRDDYPSCEFFDPLAEGMPPKAVIDIMRKLSKKMNPEKMFKYKQNLIRRQNLRSNNCGQFCIKYIEDRMNGESFCEASGYDDFIENYKGADGSDDGEKELKKILPKYNSYL